MFYELYVAGLLTYHRFEQILNCSLKILINLVHCTKLVEKELFQQISVSKPVIPGLFLAATETAEYPKFNTFASSHIPTRERYAQNSILQIRHLLRRQEILKHKKADRIIITVWFLEQSSSEEGIVFRCLPSANKLQSYFAFIHI